MCSPTRSSGGRRTSRKGRSLAQNLANAPTRSLGLINRALDASATNSLDAQLDLERDLQREATKGEDYREGIAAFLEKRAARFTGR